MHRFATLRSSALSSAKRRTASLVYLPQLNATFPRASSRRKAALSHAAQLPAARIVAAQRPAHQRNATSRKKSFAAQRPAALHRAPPRKVSLLEAPRSNSTQRLNEKKSFAAHRDALLGSALPGGAQQSTATQLNSTSRKKVFAQRRFSSLLLAQHSFAARSITTQRNVSKEKFRLAARLLRARPRHASHGSATPGSARRRFAALLMASRR